MITNFYQSVKIKGSSPLPTHGNNKARTTIKIKAPQ